MRFPCDAGKDRNMFARIVAAVPFPPAINKYALQGDQKIRLQRFVENLKVVGEVFLGNVPFESWSKPLTKTDDDEDSDDDEPVDPRKKQIELLVHADLLKNSSFKDICLNPDPEKILFKMRLLQSLLDDDPVFCLTAVTMGLHVAKTMRDYRFLLEGICIAARHHNEYQDAMLEPLSDFDDVDYVVEDMMDANTANLWPDLSEKARLAKVTKVLDKRLHPDIDYLAVLEDLYVQLHADSMTFICERFSEVQ